MMREANAKNLHKLCVVVFIFIVLVSPSFAYQLKGLDGWNEHKTDHFIIKYHPSIETSYIEECARKCEGYYGSIAERLGFNRFDFWLWEKRALIFIHQSHEDYVAATGRPLWSGASVYTQNKHIDTYYSQEDFYDTMLPHELTHIVLREFIGQKTKLPLWFEEGVACANEKNSILRYFMVAKGFIEKDIYFTMHDLNKATVHNIKTPSVFYAMSASLIIFFLDQYDKDKFVEFCNALKEKTSFYKAMEEVYAIEGVDDLEEKFLAFIKSETYEDIICNKRFSVEW